jgi:hypothetical protein
MKKLTLKSLIQMAPVFGLTLTMLAGLALPSTAHALRVPIWLDADGDGYGDSEGTPILRRMRAIPAGFVRNHTDCDDDNADANTGCVDIDGFASSETAAVTFPCSGGTGSYTVPMLFTSATEGWVGCANGAAATNQKGVYHTTDAGVTWTQIADSITCGTINTAACDLRDMQVYDIDSDDAGNIYLCGKASSSTSTTYIVKYDGSAFTDFSDYDDFTSKPGQCMNMAITGDGTETTFTSRSNTYLYTSADSGATWNYQSTWDDDTVNGYTTYEVEEFGDYFFASGTANTYPPYFFSPTSGGSFYQMDVNTIDSTIDGEVRAIATTDGGTTWIAGYTIGTADLAVTLAATDSIAYSTDAGLTWTNSTVTIDEGNGIAYYIGTVYDIACHEDGNVCLATGELDAESTGSRIGGVILISQDAGVTWVNLVHSDLVDDSLAEDYQGITFFGDAFFIMSGDTYLTGTVDI